jgi:hypothetical protein
MTNVIMARKFTSPLLFSDFVIRTPFASNDAARALFEVHTIDQIAGS